MAERPYVLSIAGIDPSAGAGLLADIKTFEQIKVYGLGVPTANTIQTADKFYANQWMPYSFLIEGIRCMLESFPIKAVKIGIIEDSDVLYQVVSLIKALKPDAFVVWDPVMQSSSLYSFQQNWLINTELTDKIDVVTPNHYEWEKLKKSASAFKDAAIVLKGGHNEEKKGYDVLYHLDRKIEIPPQHSTTMHPKHGSGCVYSSALAAYLALGEKIEDACTRAKFYVEKFLSGNEKLLGYHNGKTTVHIAG